MVKLVDMPDLGSGAARRVGSSPIIRTLRTNCPNYTLGSFFLNQKNLKSNVNFVILISLFVIIGLFISKKKN